MEKERMTIHRALCELKLIDSRIKSQLGDLSPVTIIRDGKLIGNNKYTVDEFNANAKSKYQSITDLIARKMKIKAAIVASNAKVNVTIAGETMTVSDAINFKPIAETMLQIINSMYQNYVSTVAQVNKENSLVVDRALDTARAILGKPNDGSVKITDDDVRNITDPYIKRNEVKLLDPLNIDKLTEELRTKYSDFMSNVDSELSTVNAITFINI